MSKIAPQCTNEKHGKHELPLKPGDGRGSEQPERFECKNREW